MISKDVSNTQTVRNVIIIDEKGIIRTILIYPLNVGRYIPEILRTVQALQMADCSNAMTPANWIPNEPVIVPPPQTFEELQARTEEIEKNQNGITLFKIFVNVMSKKDVPIDTKNNLKKCKKILTNR